MTKAEIKKAPNNEVIRDYVSSYARLLQNWTLQRGTTQLTKHCKDLEDELLKRNILTSEDIEILNM